MVQDEILSKYEIRKSNKEKTIFIDYLKERLAKAGYDPEKDIRVEEKGMGIFKSRNIVVGNPDEAEVLLGGHYDTCAWMPFPNLMTPITPLLFWGYQILLVIMIMAPAMLFGILVGLVFDNPVVTYFSVLLFLYVLLIQLMVGYPNKHTANDNTSGIITLTHILENLPVEERSKVCVIYFDNEEKGLFGSAFFYSKHKKQIKNKMLINFDCVGDGENIVTMADRKCRKDEKYQKFVEAFQKEEADADVKYLCKKMKLLMFPSDQMNFYKGIGVCALNKSRIGYYVGRIHTFRDTRCRKENVEYLTRAMVEFLKKI